MPALYRSKKISLIGSEKNDDAFDPNGLGCMYCLNRSNTSTISCHDGNERNSLPIKRETSKSNDAAARLVCGVSMG